MNQNDYTNLVLELNAKGTIDAYNEYRNIYPRYDQETELKYIIRCSELDFDNGNPSDMIFGECITE
jgi:hypothetical protein